MKVSLIIRSFILLALTIICAPAIATFQIDPTGTWTGVASVTETCPPTPGPPGVFTHSDDVTANISNYNAVAGTFDLTINFTEVGNPVNTGTFSGTGMSLSPTQIVINFNGTNNNGGTENWAGWADLTAPNELTFSSLTGNESGGKSCLLVVNSLVLTLGGGDLNGGIDPEVVPSNLVTSDVVELTQIVNITTNVLNSRIQSALHGSLGGPRQVTQGIMMETPAGLSAGDTFNNIGAWGSYAYSSFDNDFSRTKYDGRRYMFFGGVDFTPRDDMVLGVAVGYEDTDIDTDFNLGKLDADGWTIAPYFGWLLNDTWNIDVSAGYSDIDTDQNRSNGAITSNVNTNRWFISANVNGFTQIDNWLLTGRAGLLNAESKDDDFTEVGAGALTVNSRKTLLTQFNIGGEVAYSMDEFEPFVSAYYNNDLHASRTVLTAGAQPSNDNDDMLLGVGFRYYNDENLSISAQLDSRQGRSDIDENTFSVNVRWDF